MFDIVEIIGNPYLSPEEMGSKPKRWIKHPFTEEECLLKLARPKTGEAWSEMIAAELAEKLKIPHAKYELAKQEGRYGTLSRNFTNGHTLIHGNEILVENDPTYERDKKRKLSKYTVEVIFKALEGEDKHLPFEFNSSVPVKTVSGVFVSYLMLDALIGNTDRHHENWGFIQYVESGCQILRLAPTYDHASSLGRELTDEKRERMLRPKNDNRVTIEAYVGKTKSALYRSSRLRDLLSPLAAFKKAKQMFPSEGSVWLELLKELEPSKIDSVIEQVPDETNIGFSSIAREFTRSFLRINQKNLLESNYD